MGRSCVVYVFVCDKLFNILLDSKLDRKDKLFVVNEVKYRKWKLYICWMQFTTQFIIYLMNSWLLIG